MDTDFTEGSGRTTAMYKKVLVAQLCLTLCNPIDYSPPGSSLHGIPRQEYWSGCCSLLQGIFPTQGSNLSFPHCRQILLLFEPPGKPMYMYINMYMGFPGGSTDKESTSNAGDLGSVPELGRSPGEGNSYALQYFGLENSMDCIVHGVTKSGTGLSNFHTSS